MAQIIKALKRSRSRRQRRRSRARGANKRGLEGKESAKKGLEVCQPMG
jgi:hypothetical protein